MLIFINFLFIFVHFGLRVSTTGLGVLLAGSGCGLLGGSHTAHPHCGRQVQYSSSKSCFAMFLLGFDSRYIVMSCFFWGRGGGVRFPLTLIFLLYKYFSFSRYTAWDRLFYSSLFRLVRVNSPVSNNIEIKY